MNMFSKFARFLSNVLGTSLAFNIAVSFVILWLITGPIFKFSIGWQLIVNTSANIITLLMVFLLQNTQNRNTIAIQLKLDEIIRAMEGTHNELLKVEQLSDKDLNELLKRYEDLAGEVKKKIKKGESDLGSPKVKKGEEKPPTL
jgi:low affinity Fe/Cu permease